MRELSSDANWERLGHVLDEAISRLGAKDRDAVLLRYFERKELRAVGDALGTSEEAARKRVSRALERLRRYLTTRGVTLSAAMLATALTGNAVQAAPAALAGAISAAVFAGAAVAAAGSTFNLLNLMSITKLKAGILSAAVVVGAGTPVVVQQQTVSRLRAENLELREQSQQFGQLRAENEQLKQVQVQLDEMARLQKENQELHRLRNEVRVFREQSQKLAAAEVQQLQQQTQQLAAENQRLRAGIQKIQQERTTEWQVDACINNLRIIEGAKDQWALENKKGTEDAVDAAGLAPYLKHNVFPWCPASGVYTINPIGTVATCNLPGHMVD